MKLAIIGGTGFLGKYFLEEYGPTFSQIKRLTRTGISLDNVQTGTLSLVKGTLGDQNAIESLVSGMDVLVHAGFDHTYTENIRGIHHILRAVTSPENTIRRVVYLSSYVVYDRNRGDLTEESALSNYCDIYTKEKIAIETIIRESASPVEFIILQPTIVLGSGGNWTKVLAEAAHSEVVKLSDGGATTCNFVHVRDVAHAIERAIKIPAQKLPTPITSFLVTGGRATWKEVLTIHGGAKASGDSPNLLKARIEGTFNGKYGNSFLKNLIIGTLYAPRLRAFMHPALKYAKRRMEQSKLTNKRSPSRSEYGFQGLPKAIQQVEHQVISEKSRRILGYIPTFTLLKIAADISRLIEVNKNETSSLKE